MPSLVVPESGIIFASKPGSTMPTTVVGVTLTDIVIEEMIKCVQKGKPIQLALGDRPKLLYGTKIQPLHTSESPFTHEIYRSLSECSNNPDMHRPLKANPKMGVIKVENKSHPQFLAMLGVKSLTMKKITTPAKATPKPTPTSTSTTSKTPSLTSGTDAALAALQSSYDIAKKAVNTTKFVKDMPPQNQRKGAAGAKLGNRAKFLQGPARATDATRSMPSSPNLTGVGSPSLGPTSAPLSQQQAEQAKATRKPVVHLLALRPMAETELKMKIRDASNNDIKQALDKVGDLNNTSGKWELRKSFFKELDVFAFKYDSDEDRQRAIDNAVKQYDRMRMGISEPEWDRLLPKEERGTGKCLSKLQAQIAQGTAAKAPKINIQKAEDSGRDTPMVGDGDDEGILGDKTLSKLKGESMNRSVSQPPTTKSKKSSEKEAQTKRLLSKNPPKPKATPTKREKPAQKGAARVLSSQFVSDSDEEDDYMISKPDPKPTTTSTKRSREEDAETSDSSIPLSKKVKKDTSNHRISDASQTTNTTSYSSSSSKTKSNSPQKSSPLASSPPTNASEFENSSGHTSSSASPAHHSIKVSRSPIHKRHQKSSSVASSASSTTSTRSLRPEIMDLARRYRTFYPKYEALHKEVASLGKGGRRDSEKEQMLLDMHQRLSDMKKDIAAGIVEAN